MVRLNHSVHTLTVAPPGAGKTTALVVPFLRECRDSVVVNDIKGEIYTLESLCNRPENGSNRLPDKALRLDHRFGRNLILYLGFRSIAQRLF
jgi:hypothetical protein